ncbi:hypothetical protein GCM10025786_22600 [Nocardioides caeni]
MLKAGAHAAWAVPAVQVATMVPAMAASGTPTLAVAVARTISGTTMAATVTVSASAGAGTISNVQLTLSGAGLSSTSALSENSANWSAFTTRTTTYNGSLTPGTSLTTFTVTITNIDKGGSNGQPILFAVSGAGANAGSTSVQTK